MYKLIAVDIDGTLLNSYGQISEANKKAIKRAVENGIKVVICSGRVFAGARYFAGQLELKDPVISCNGAEIREFDSKKLLYGSYINLKDCLEIVDIARRENIYVHSYVGKTMYTERLGFASNLYKTINKQLRKNDRIDIRVVKSMKRVFQLNKAPASKFVFISKDTELLAKVKDMVKKIETVDITSSYYDNIEVINKGVDKGNALKILSGILSIDRKEIIAIGDNENDRTMLEFAGLGVVMGNAGEHIRKLAGYVTSDNDNDGVAEVFEQFVFKGM